MRRIDSDLQISRLFWGELSTAGTGSPSPNSTPLKGGLRARQNSTYMAKHGRGLLGFAKVVSVIPGLDGRALLAFGSALPVPPGAPLFV